MRLIVGDDGLTLLEKTYLQFGGLFERNFLAQGKEARTLSDSEKIAWKCLSVLPGSELFKLPPNYVSEKIEKEQVPS